MEIRTKIELQAVEIQNVNAQTSDKCDRVVECYKSAKIFQSESDLFYLQQEFIASAFNQTLTQRSFGLMLIELLETV